MPELDPGQRERIEKTIATQGLSLTGVSTAAGRNPSWLSKRLHHGTGFRQEEFAVLGGILGVPPQWLATGDASISDAPVGGMLAPGKMDLPLRRGFSVGGLAAVGVTEVGREIIIRPAVLFGVEDAFAVRIADDRMRPRYRRGDILYFHPGSEPEAGDCIAAELLDGTYRLGLLVVVDEGRVTMESLSPHELETVGAVRSIAREVGVARR